MTPPGPEALREAAARIAPHIRRTPVLRHPLLDERAGAPVFVKAEPLQRTGSFKLRGATNAAVRLPRGSRIVTHSSGNHGQAVACAAATLGHAALIAMPADAPAIKVESTRRWGAEITFFDRATTDRETLAARLAAERGGTVVPPFDHPDVIAGQGTAALELFEDAGAAIETLAVCTGGGGLVAGCALAAELASPGTRVFAVEPEGWDDTARSLAAGERIRNDGQGSTLCDALLSMRPGELTFAINRARLAGAVVVSEAEVFEAIRFAFLHLKVVVEPGGAVALAAVLSGKLRGGAIGVILSGGNVDPVTFARAWA